MTKHLIALLTDKFKGERKDGLTVLARSLALQAKTQDDATALVEQLTPELVQAFVKEYRSDVDRETSEAIKKVRGKTEPSPQDPEPQDPEPQDPEPQDPSPKGNGKSLEEVIARAVQKAVSPLQEKITAYEQRELSTQRMAQVREAIKDCRDDLFQQKALRDFGRMTFNDDNSFAEYVAELKTDAENADKRITTQALSGFGRVPLPSGEGEPSKEAVADILKRIG